MNEAGFDRELLIFLATAGVVVPLFGKLRFGVVPGFLIAGVLLGPGGLGSLADDFPWLRFITIADPERVQPFADLGVLFLLFLIGLEFSLERLWAMRIYVLGLGSLQFFLCAALIAAGASALGLDFPVALVAGLAFALSSTAIVTQSLIEARRFTAPVGRASLGVLIFQDLMVVPIVIVVGLLGGDGEVEVGGALLQAVGLAVAALAAIVLAGRYLIRPLLRLAASTGSRDLVVAIALFLAVGTAVLTASVGLSAALGAFLAGILLGGSEYRHQLEVDIEPFKGLLLGLFFMVVGMSFNVSAVESGFMLLAACLAAILVVKGAVVFGAGRALGLSTVLSVEVAFLLAGAGEFAFVVFTLAAREDLLDPAMQQFFVSVAAVAMIAVPVLAVVGRRIGDRAAHERDTARHGAEGAGEGLDGHVVIGGFGRIGKVVARLLDEEGIRYVALDLDADLVAEEREAGAAIFYGDASRREILDQVGGGRARAFVVTTDEPKASERMVGAIRHAWPGAVVHARALDGVHARRLARLGATGVVPEALEGSLLLAAQVLTGIGLPDDAVDERIARLRDAELKRVNEILSEQS